MESEYLDQGIAIVSVNGDNEKIRKYLPPEWPHIKELDRAESCLHTNVFSTCVNKAQSHLELLQNAVYDWLCEREQNQLNTHLSSSEGLEIIGSGLGDGKNGTTLGVDEVVESVSRLITRLESSRIHLEQCILTERKKVSQLADKIEQLGQLRMRLLPDAVEREHENCATNIEELHWHIIHQTSQRDRLREERDTAKMKRELMEEEINFIDEHNPLLQEKFNSELELVRKIQEAQRKIHDELVATEDHCKQLEVRHQAAVTEAESERSKMRSQIEFSEKQFKSATTTLEKSRENCLLLTDKFATAQALKQENKERIKELHEVILTAHQKEKDSIETTKLLKGDLMNAKINRRNLEEAVELLKEEQKSKQTAHDSQRADMITALHNREDLFTQLRRANDEKKMICNDLEAKLLECQSQMTSDDKNFQRMNTELLKIRAEVEQLEENFERALSQHATIKEKMNSEERRIREAEDKLRHTITQLERQIQDEIKQRGNLQTRIKTDTLDLSKSKEEAKIKRRKMRQMVAEIEKAVEAMLEKVKHLREQKQQSETVVNGVQAELDEIIAEHKQVENTLMLEIQSLQPDYDATSKELIELNKKWDNINWQIDMMNKKLQEMLEQSVMIKRAREKVFTEIRSLETKLHSLTVKWQSDFRTEESLNKLQSGLEIRLETMSNEHRKYIQERNETMKIHLDHLDDCLQKNKILAGKYRALQDQYLELKGRFLNLFAEKLLKENALVDLKQVEKLQSYMHFNLVTFLRCKDNYSLREVDRLLDDSTVTCSTVSLVKNQMKTAVGNLSEFMDVQIRALRYGQRFAENNETKKESNKETVVNS